MTVGLRVLCVLSGLAAFGCGEDEPEALVVGRRQAADAAADPIDGGSRTGSAPRGAPVVAGDAGGALGSPDLSPRDSGSGSEAPSSTEPATRFTPEEGSALITVAGGGLVETAEGYARLVVAPGSVTEDVTITLRRVSGTPYGFEDWGLMIEPVGVFFNPEAQLSIATPDFESPVPYTEHGISGFEPDKPPTWRWTGDNRLEDGRLSTAVPLSGFSAIDWKLVRLPVPCPLPSAQSACGGEVEGDWDLLGFCYEHLQPFFFVHWEDSTDDGCEATGFVNASEWVMPTRAHFADGRFTRAAATAPVPLRTEVARCATDGTCEELVTGFELPAGSCSGTDPCHCTYGPEQSLPALDVPYSQDATTLTFGDDAPRGYCVEGDRLVIGEGEGTALRLAVYRRSP